MVTVQMAANDHESFHLLQISESASDSLPDLDLVTLNTQHKKKKVRLKRFVLWLVVNTHSILCDKLASS